GAYSLAEAEGGKPDVILIGTGSEVSLCVKAKERLKGYGVNVRVVSMPSNNLFEAQPEVYKESVLPKSCTKRVTVEAGSAFGWDRYAGPEGAMIGLDRFGASAPGDEIMALLGYRPEHVAAVALQILGREAESKQEDASDVQ